MLVRLEQEIRETLDKSFARMNGLSEPERTAMAMQMLSFLQGMNENGHLNTPREVEHYYDGLYVPVAGTLYYSATNQEMCIYFTRTETKLMDLLTSYPNQLVKKEDIIREIWGDSALHTSTRDAYNVTLHRTKKKIQPAEAVSIEVKHGQGLVLNGKIRRCAIFHPLLYDPGFPLKENGNGQLEVKRVEIQYPWGK